MTAVLAVHAHSLAELLAVRELLHISAHDGVVADTLATVAHDVLRFTHVLLIVKQDLNKLLRCLLPVATDVGLVSSVTALVTDHAVVLNWLPLNDAKVGQDLQVVVLWADDALQVHLLTVGTLWAKAVHVILADLAPPV